MLQLTTPPVLKNTPSFVTFNLAKLQLHIHLKSEFSGVVDERMMPSLCLLTMTLLIWH